MLPSMPGPGVEHRARRLPQVHRGQRVRLDQQRTDLARQPGVVRRRGVPASPMSASAVMVTDPPPMDTRSLPSVAIATRPPGVHGADHVAVGHEHVVEEHLVEQRLAGDLGERADLDGWVGRGR